MKTYNAFYFLKDSTVTGVSASHGNYNGGTLTLVVDGTFTSAEIAVEGTIGTGTFFELSTIDQNLHTQTSITAKGIYVASIGDCDAYRVNVKSVSGGNITVYAKMEE